MITKQVKRIKKQKFVNKIKELLIEYETGNISFTDMISSIDNLLIL